MIQDALVNQVDAESAPQGPVALWVHFEFVPGATLQERSIVW